jgi:hypothetical protein
MRRTLIVFVGSILLSAATLAACGESSSENGKSSSGGTTTPAEGGSTGETSTEPTDGASSVDAAIISVGPLLLNEVSASAEWVELVSAAVQDLDVSGYKVADESKDGGPKLGEAVTFPAGTVLPSKAYIVVKGGGLDGGGKPCPDGGQKYCFNAQFGISNKNGDVIYLLDPTNQVVGTVTYPAKVASGDAGESWGRIPSGEPTGVFKLNVATPGAVNIAK